MNSSKVIDCMWIEESYTLIIRTTFRGKDNLERSLQATGIDSLETAQAFVDHLGLNTKVISSYMKENQ